MGMLTTENQDQFAATLKSFVDVSRKNYCYAYTTGYLQSLAEELFRNMSKQKQKQMIEDMRRSTLLQQQQLQEKLSQNQTFERV